MFMSLFTLRPPNTPEQLFNRRGVNRFTVDANVIKTNVAGICKIFKMD